MNNVDQLKKAFHESDVKKRYLFHYCNSCPKGMRKITRKAYSSHNSIVVVLPRGLADTIGISPGTNIEFRLTDLRTLALSPVPTEVEK